MKSKNFKRRVAGLFISALIVGAPALAQAPRTFRLGHNLPITTVYHKAAALFAEEVGKLSSGRMNWILISLPSGWETKVSVRTVRPAASALAQLFDPWWSPIRTSCPLSFRLSAWA